ncbi:MULTISPECIES: radical SAM family heme chaperone HemW [unclassified Prochlorococcus]|uniref:radical SAM family heme chaperone HemW n=1 Tax=unclassified Prochlorococcus TaxID=2627481 RepID=UPI0005337C58|nr:MULTISPECIES: radical SAM family heme chaperone HemW [unclassified Prochlorococcus]KGG16258.1 Oxygen independent coproporphyrinogen III oxidase [Prochlorococcus sp. MIT 0603]KGG18008.1 Oxygen independent coproporphyrinogen III oxidase [Prochlorococcus sp. MIT 0602]
MNYSQSAYLHIPFCHRRCFYCNFAVVPLGDRADGETGPGSSSIKGYLNLLYRDISLAPKTGALSTVYIGGGTPSLLSAAQIADLLDHLRFHFGIQYGAEITLEIDPASFDKISLEGYIAAGINRVSLGAQSFDNNVLYELGRRHTFDQLIDSCNWINESFKEGRLFSWNLDLIQNLPNQNLASWSEQLVKAIDIYPPHLSIYDLSIEEGTVFAWKMNKGDLCLPNDEIASDISKITSMKLKEAGYSRYEISNFALPGHASRHNRVYWSGANWWGFGQGATSCPWGERLSKPRTRNAYKKWLEIEESKVHKSSFKTIYKHKNIPLDDLLIVGLRRREGIDLYELLERFEYNNSQINFNISKLKQRWQYGLNMGWIKQRGFRFHLTDPDGMQLSNQFLVDMLLWLDSLTNSHSAEAPNLEGYQ